IWVLSKCFLSAAPTRIAEYVDVRGPECEAFVASALTMTHKLMMLCPRLSRNHIRNGMHQFRIECRRQSDRLRKYRRYSGSRHTMQRLVPPFIFRNSESLDRLGAIHHLRNLLLESHARD